MTGLLPTENYQFSRRTTVQAAHRKAARYVEAQPASGPHRPAMPAHWVIEEGGEVFTRALDVTELHQHRDDIARVLASCDANSEPWDDLPGYARAALRRRADAVLAYLTDCDS